MKVKDVDFRLVLGSAAENKPGVHNLNGYDYNVSWNGVEWELEVVETTTLLIISFGDV